MKRDDVKVAYKHIEFEEDTFDDDIKKTNWHCFSRSRGGGGEDLGNVFFDTNWNKFVWEQLPGVIFDANCIGDLHTFMEQLGKVRE
jgi:hypothetical protein